MSYTEIFTFNKDGLCCDEYDVNNAWRGAMAVWGILEEKYLPPYRPSYVPEGMSMEEFEERFGYKPSRLSITAAAEKENPATEIWKLLENETVSLNDRIVLGTTLDRVLIRRDEIGKVIRAFRNFDGETNLKEQADILNEIMKNEEISAVGWNQTSVNVDTWMTGGGLSDNNEGRLPYNYQEQDDHWWLFDELEEL